MCIPEFVVIGAGHFNCKKLLLISTVNLIFALYWLDT